MPLLPVSRTGGHKVRHLLVQGSKKRPLVDFGEVVEKDLSGHLPCSFFTHDIDYLMVSDEKESVFALLALAALKSKLGRQWGSSVPSFSLFC